jgi:predicted AAA+ superfamily ATPase
MVRRDYWIQRIEALWRLRSVVWLTGVRRVGKTCLATSLSDVEYYDCDELAVRASLRDPMSFLAPLRGKRVVLDEVYRVDDPSAVLKNAADHYPDVKIVATGSSRISASRKFRDALTGRKYELHLRPLVLPDLAPFGNTDLTHRLAIGGLPEHFLAPQPEAAFREWMDSFWAKDIQELFPVEQYGPFRRFVELLLADSGGTFEASRFAAACELSRPTISRYLAILEATHVAIVVRPFTTRRAAEIVAVPRVYGFDTGFVAHYRGWRELRSEDRGALWQHFVLNELLARLDLDRLHYWRDKRGHEVDLVVARPGRDPVAIECEWSQTHADALRGVAAFRRSYPDGDNYVVTSDATQSLPVSDAGTSATVVSLEDLVARLGQEWTDASRRLDSDQTDCSTSTKPRS